MKKSIAVRPFSVAAAVTSGLSLALAGCATTPVKPAVASPPPPPAATDHVQMAPIANPTVVQREPAHEVEHEREHAREPQREDHPAPDAAQKHEAAKLAPTVDPARAAQLRAAGLEQLNRGAIRKAVALLEEARRLDPNNALIKRDLERAVRISHAVAGKP